MPSAIAKVGDVIIAESDNTVLIEGNHYFPPNSVDMSKFIDSELHTTCPWKGQASYKSVVIDDEKLESVAWLYPVISEHAKQRVGQDFSGWVAFYTNRGIDVQER